MSTKAALAFVDAVIQNFPPYRWDEDQEKNWTQRMIKELGGYADDVLDRASKELIRNRKDRRTPLLAECIKACKEAKFWVDAEKRATELPVDQKDSAQKYIEWSDHRQKLADELVMGVMGKQAAKEGWTLSLHEYVAQNGHLPKESFEVEKLKRQAKGFDAAYEATVRGGWAQAKGLEALGASMLRRRNGLIDMVLHGVVK